MKVFEKLKKKIEQEKQMRAIQKEDCYRRSRAYLKAHILGQEAYLNNPYKDRNNPYAGDRWSWWIYGGSSERCRGWEAGWAHEWYKDYKKELESKRAIKQT